MRAQKPSKICGKPSRAIRRQETSIPTPLPSQKRQIATQKGETLSILPLGGNAIVNCSNNLEYPLEDLLLTASDTRGLSNVSKGGLVTVDVKAGTALVFRYLKK